MQKGSAIYSVELAQIFKALWEHIRKEGVNVTPKAGFGGMWTAEGIWELDGARAMMSDGGYGESITAPNVRVWIQYSGGDADHTVHFSEGIQDDLMELAVKVGKMNFDKKQDEDEIDHTGD